jgi:hypothetical protein
LIITKWLKKLYCILYLLSYDFHSYKKFFYFNLIIYILFKTHFSNFNKFFKNIFKSYHNMLAFYK